MGIITTNEGWDIWINKDKRIESQEATQEIWKILNQEFSITEDEMKIIEKIPNPKIRNIIRQIIDELGKRICNGENPSENLLWKVYREILYKNKEKAGIHGKYTQQILYRLPDWKNFANLFERNERPNYYVEEFRKKRWQKTEDQAPIPTKPTSSEQKPSDKEPPITRKIEYKPQQETAKKEPETKPQTTEIEQTSNVPRLENKDISLSMCISADCGTHTLMTWLKTEVPDFDPRQDFRETDWVKCVYKGDITYIIFSVVPWKPIINLGIKGKVSKQDATELLKILQEKNIFELNPLTGNIMKIDGKFVKDIYSHWFKEIWEKVQWIVMDYFNNK